MFADHQNEQRSDPGLFARIQSLLRLLITAEAAVAPRKPVMRARLRHHENCVCATRYSRILTGQRRFHARSSWPTILRSAPTAALSFQCFRHRFRRPAVQLLLFQHACACWQVGKLPSRLTSIGGFGINPIPCRARSSHRLSIARDDGTPSARCAAV